MIAKITHVATKLVLALDAGTENGRKVTKRVTISNLREDVSADAIWEMADALEKLLKYPVLSVKIHTVSLIERAAEEKGGDAEIAAGTIIEAAGAKNSRPDGRAAAPGIAGRGKNGLPGRSCNEGYLKEPRLIVFSSGNDRVRRTPQGVVGAAIPNETPLACTRPPPLRQGVWVSSID